MPSRERPDREGDAQVALVPLDRLRAHPRNIRTDLGDLRELTGSIAAEGVLVPLMAERRGPYLQILHGHRRAAAARHAGLHKVPAVVVAAHAPDQAVAVMIAENTARRNLGVAERQNAVCALRDEFGWSMPGIAARLGIGESTAYRWAQGADAASVRNADGGQRPPGGPQPGWGGARPTRKPRIKADRVHDLLVRWDGHAPAALLDDVRALLQGWSPTTSPDTAGDDDPHQPVDLGHTAAVS